MLAMIVQKLKQLNVTLSYLSMNQKQININNNENNAAEMNQYQSLKIELNALQKQNESIKIA